MSSRDDLRVRDSSGWVMFLILTLYLHTVESPIWGLLPIGAEISV